MVTVLEILQTMPLPVHSKFANGSQLLAQASQSFGDWINELWEVSPLVLVTYGGAFVLGILFALLLPRRKSKRKESEYLPIAIGEPEAAVSTSEVPVELKWRHEKLVLADRQIQERHQRLGKFSDWLGENRGSLLSHPAGALFYLGESIREERHLIGSEISKMNLMLNRLSEFSEEIQHARGGSDESWDAELSGCREDLAQKVEILKTRQGELRAILKSVIDLEEKFFSPGGERSLDPGETEGRLSRVIESVERLQAGIHGSVVVSVQRVSALLDAPEDVLPDRLRAELDRFLTVISIDGENLVGKGKTGLLEAAEKALEAFRKRHSFQKPEAAGRPSPDSGFRSPVFFGDSPEGAGSGLPSKNVFSEDKLFVSPEVEDSEEVGAETGEIENSESDDPDELPSDFKQVIFCSNDPLIWNQTVYRGARSRAKNLSELPDGIEWVGLKRLDTGEQIFCRCTNRDLSGSGDGYANGFNGSNELFYEAHHLGMFSETCEGEVETRFTYGGWGFGHRVTGFDDETGGPAQASGWAGKLISSDTVFEVTVYKTLPKTVSAEQVLPASGNAIAEIVR